MKQTKDKGLNIDSIKKRMKKWTDSAGFDLSADIDSIKIEEDVRKILQTHRNWLDDLANEAGRSTDDFEKELLGN